MNFLSFSLKRAILVVENISAQLSWKCAAGNSSQNNKTGTTKWILWSNHPNCIVKVIWVGSGDLSFICTMYRLKRHVYQYSLGLYSFPFPSGLLSCHLRLSNSTTMSLKSYRSYLYLSVEGSGWKRKKVLWIWNTKTALQVACKIMFFTFLSFADRHQKDSTEVFVSLSCESVPVLTGPPSTHPWPFFSNDNDKKYLLDLA